MTKKNTPRVLAALALACGLAISPALTAEATTEAFSGTVYGTGTVTNYSTPRYHAAGSVTINLTPAPCGGSQYLWLRNSSGTRISRDAVWGGAAATRTVYNTSGGLAIPSGTFKLSGINSGSCIGGSDVFYGTIFF